MIFCDGGSKTKMWIADNKTHNKRWLVPDLSDALKQRIQREAFLCNELTIREEDLSKDNEEDEGDIEQEEII